VKQYNYIVIEGNIGAGKTSLARLLADKFDARLILERLNENPFLPGFYADPEKYSFSLELSFLAERYHQLNDELQKRDLFKPLTITDYYLMKSLIFSRTNLSENEYQLYRKIFNIISNNIVKPDLYVYLHLSLDKLIKNIKNRGRHFEQKIQKEYLVKIQEGYMDFFKQQKDFPIVMIDANELDFCNKISDFEKIVNIIFDNDYPMGVNKVIP
jgi:deoxyguanosine kinase